MPGPPLPDDQDLKSCLRRIGAELDFTDEACLQQLVERLTLDGDQTSVTTVLGRTTDDRSRWETLVGRRFDDYELLELIAEGGMGVVFRARQLSLNRIVALKMIRSGELASAGELKRFKAESEIAAKLEHPGIVPIYETGSICEWPFYSMAFIDGVSLSEKLRQGPMTSAQVAELAVSIAGTIQYAHDRGVAHRDLKPSNILLLPQLNRDYRGKSKTQIASGTDCVAAKVTDFGLAAMLNHSSNVTVTGEVIGTPSYMAPEQACGTVRDAKLVDVYAIGAILYAMLTGRPPFQSGTVLQTLRQVVDSDPVLPMRLNAGVDRDLENICLKCLRKDPDQRYGTAAAVAADLQRFLRGEPVHARPLAPLQLGWRWCRRHPTRAALLAVGFLSMIVLSMLSIVSSRLALAQSQMLQLETEVTMRRRELIDAQRIANAQTQLAEARQYHAEMATIREQADRRNLGWRSSSLAQLAEISKLPTEIANPLEIRNLSARCLLGTDLKKIVEIEFGNDTAYLPAIHPQGNQVAVAIQKGQSEVKVLIVHVPSGDITHTLTAAATTVGKMDGIRKLAWLDQGDTIAATTRGGMLHRWDLSNSKPALQSNLIPYGEIDSDRFAFDTVRGQAYLSISNQLHRWPDFDSPQTQPLGIRPAERLTISRDGRRLAVNDLIYDTHQDRSAQRLVGLGLNVGFSDDGRFVLGEGLFDLQSGRMLFQLIDPATGRTHEDAITQLEISPSGRFFLTGGHDQKFKLWNAESCRPIHQVQLMGSSEVRAVFSNDNRFVAAVGGNRLVVFDIEGLAMSTNLGGHATPVEDYAVAHNAGIVACVAKSHGTNHKQVTLWDPESGACLDRWSVPGYPLIKSNIAISNDGQHLCISNHDRIYSWSFSKPWSEAKPDLRQRRVAFAAPFQAGFLENRWTPLVEGVANGSWPLTDFGLDWQHVDAAVNWGNGLAMLFSGEHCCLLDPETNSTAPAEALATFESWPNRWRQELDAAILHENGAAYFFRGDQYIRVDVPSGRINQGYPKPISQGWAGIFPNKNDAASDFNDLDGHSWFVRANQGVRFVKRSEFLGPIPLNQTPLHHHDFDRFDALLDMRFRTLPHHTVPCQYAEVKLKRPAVSLIKFAGDALLSVEDDLTITRRALPGLQLISQWTNTNAETRIGVGTITSLAITDNELIAGSKNGTILIGNRSEMSDFRQVATGERIMSVWANENTAVSIWGSQEGKLGSTPLTHRTAPAPRVGHQREISSIVGSRDGSLVLTGSHDHQIILWTLQDHALQPLLTLTFPGAIGKLELINGDSELLVSVMGERSLRRIQLQSLLKQLADISGETVFGLGTHPSTFAP